MSKVKIVFLLIFVSICLFRCSDTLEPDFSRLGYTYFPLEKGHYRIYDVENINYSLLGFDTTYFQLKEQVVDSFLNQEGYYTYILHRFTREDSNAAWKLDSVWNARNNTRQLIVFENNIPFIKLAFPVKEENTWDGNAMNDKAFDEYELKDLLKEEEFEGNNIKTLTVIHGEEEDLLSKDDRFEIYGENIGMISKLFLKLEYCDDPDCFGQKKIEAGRSKKLSLIAYGKE